MVRYSCDVDDWVQDAYPSQESEGGSGMAANTRVDIARSDVVESLLRPAYLREARQGMRQGRVSEAELQEHTVVVGLVTTKNPMLENAAAVEARLREATQHIPLERLAVSPQCGFASGEAGNPLTPEEQAAKLRLVAKVAQRVWPR